MTRLDKKLKFLNHNTTLLNNGLTRPDPFDPFIDKIYKNKNKNTNLNLNFKKNHTV
jgi:hypothetical protein